ncbi:MAG: tetratricopeptide repeat protein [Pyrinomonadaceae bacterium]|nr:tetratricopeptide repeat protein [Pyrinomonadaceae bacterium]
MPCTRLATKRQYALRSCGFLILALLLFSTPASAYAQRTEYSKNKEADALMREGESYFAAEQWDKAREAYEKALKLDPNIYEAPLFIGDVYFQKRQMDKAGDWYAKAIAIDPNRETAYRYWSDAYLRVGKMVESRDKAVEAIVAEPYNRMSYRGLMQWAQVNKVQLAHPKIEVPAGISSNKPGEVNITLDPKLLEGKEDGSSAWLVYSITRANWRTTKFAKTFPKEQTYRHSLAEELDAFQMVISSVKADKKVKKLEDSLANLVRLNDAGLLEAYILLARADDGIAQDYEEYRRLNRDKIRKYLTDVVAGEFKQQGKF